MQSVVTEEFYAIINDKNICIGRIKMSDHELHYSIERNSKELCIFHPQIETFEALLKYSSEYLQGSRPACGKITHDFFVIESHDNVAATLFMGTTMTCTKLEPFALSPVLAIQDTSEVRNLLHLLSMVKKLL